MDHRRKLRVGYLANQYPAISHTFIRREIVAVEATNLVEVVRYSLDDSPSGIVDEQDEREAERTRVIQNLGVLSLVGLFLRTGVSSPTRMIRACLLALAVGRRSDRGLLRHLAYLVEACALLAMARDDGVDHVHAQFGTNATTVAMLCNELGGPPFSFTMHGPLEFDRAPLLGLHVKIARARFVAAITDFCRAQTLLNSAVEDHTKIHVVTCGVDMGYFNIDPTPIPSEPRLVFVGRLTRLKAPDLLIESLSRLHQEGVDFHLTIAGDGDMRSELLSMITRHGLTQKVTMLGYCDENGVRDQILAARALVLPSFSEGLPVVLMEALALERPVVSTYIAGIPELVLPGRNGWLVPAGSIEALTVALRDVLSSPVDRLATMGRAGRASVESRHNVAKSGQLLADLFVKANNKCE